MTPPQIYWRLRETYHLPRFLARPLARFWQKRQERAARRVRQKKIVLRKADGSTALAFTVNVRIAREFYIRLWLVERLLRLDTRILSIEFEKRIAGEWYEIGGNASPLGEDVLLWDGQCCVVGCLCHDGKYYAPQEAAPVRVQYWAYLFPSPEDEEEA